MPKRGLTAADVRRIALELPESIESTHMGHPDFRVRGKIFASLTHDECQAAAKIDPAELDVLVTRAPETFRNAWGGRWVGVRLDRVTETMLRRLFQDAWRLVAPKELAGGPHRFATSPRGRRAPRRPRRRS